MRLSILINTSDPTVSHDYAVLWLEIAAQVWSRQLCKGIDLPLFGEIREAEDLTTLCSTGAQTPLCTLRGLRLDRYQRVPIVEGVATWQSVNRRIPIYGSWRLQAVEWQPPIAKAPAIAPPGAKQYGASGRLSSRHTA
jgi:hypothetical protein